MDNIYSIAKSIVSNHDHILQNLYIFNWECDVFSVTKTGYSYELEIKISRSDFKADFKKDKHKIFNNWKKGYYAYGLGRRGWGFDNAEYSILSSGKITYQTCANKFFYVVPEGLIKEDEVPDYAGLIYCNEDFGGSYKTIKQAPFIHKDKCDVPKLLFDKYYWQYRHQQIKIQQLESYIQTLKNNPDVPL